MPRLPLADPATFTGPIAEAYKGPSGRTNIFRLLALAPTCMPGFSQLAQAVFAQLEVPEVDRELLVLAVAQMEGGAYEWMQHVQIAQAMGVDEARIAAIRAEDFDNPLFTPGQRALLAFARQSVRNIRVEAAVFDELKRFYSPRQIVESLFTIGQYMFLARLTEAVELELDAPQGAEVVKAAKARAREDGR